MTRWVNFPQKKGQEEITVRDLLKIGISNISEQESRTRVIRLVARLEESREDTRENFATGIKDLKTSQD